MYFRLGARAIHRRTIHLGAIHLHNLNRSDQTIPIPGQCFYKPRVLGVIPQCLAQFIHGSVNAVFKINEGIGGPEFLLDLFPRHHLAGLLEERGENLERSLLELDFVAVSPHFTASKVYFKLSDAEARNCCGWDLHGGLNQLFRS
jgi:hypothetical protein